MKVNLIPSLACAAIITGAGALSGQPLLGTTVGVSVILQASTAAQLKLSSNKIEQTLTKFQQQQAQVNHNLSTCLNNIALLENALADFRSSSDQVSQNVSSCINNLTLLENAIADFGTSQNQVNQSLFQNVGDLTRSVAQSNQTLQKHNQQLETQSKKLAVYNTRLNLFFGKLSQLEHKVKVLSAKPAPVVAATVARKKEVKLPIIPKDTAKTTQAQAKKVLCVIDANNFKLCREKMSGDVNYSALKTYVASWGDQFQITYVMGESATAKNLVKNLAKNGYDVVSLPVVPTADNGYKTLGDDIKVAKIMGEQSNPGDVVILVSGDGDYVPTVKELQEKGVEVIVLSHPEVISSSLKNACDKFIDLNSIWLNIVQYGEVIKPIKKTA